MEIIRTVEDMRGYMKKTPKGKNFSVGFVPTMGYFHEGHISLMKRASEENKRVVVSIFVNPMQFAPNEDFEKYPRDEKRDLKLLEESSAVDAVFIPGAEEMYPERFASCAAVENDMSKRLCGVSRPEHFKGVTTVVAKLFNIIAPDKIYLGQKDMQQAVIIKKMIEDLNYGVETVICPTVREKDGLAMSSRNEYLSPEERNTAPVLYRALQVAESMAELGEESTADVVKEVKRKLKEANITIDYVEAVDADTLEKKEKFEGRVLIAAAVFVGKIRLIDNAMICME